MMFEYLIEPFAHFFRVTDRVYWVYLVAALMIALVVYLRRFGGGHSLKDFVAFCFPGRIWRHPSTRTDIFYFVANRILFLVLFSPLFLLVYPAANLLIYDALCMLGEPKNWFAPDVVVGLYAVSVILVVDFVRFLGHYLQHKVEFLWQFHKVHHSAAVLTPLTVYRMHPVDDLLITSLFVIFVAALHASFSFLFINDVSFWTLDNVTLAAIVFYLLGYNLRHSHVWLSYGPLLSRWLVSPAQHQIHHSCRPEHIDRNIGFMFAIWDRLFGTLYVPVAEEELTLGLHDEPEGNFATAMDCYTRPFRLCFRQHRLLTSILVIGLAGAGTVSVGQALPMTRVGSVQLAELTWKEVEELLQDGILTVIVPTGGVEQNGEHLMLGKHNPVITYAAEQIATELGDALVAPTITYVPEGNIDPPEGHMAFPGTLSVREETFEALLEDTARSLIQHGFRFVCFVGDSGGNQSAQARVAEKLNREFSEQDVRVVHVGDYYEANGQREWLEGHGFGEEEIGSHAGIRDSSELMFVHPGGVRMGSLRLSGQRRGVSGSYWKSSAEIGRTMIELKVAAAVRQIQAARDARVEISE